MSKQKMIMKRSTPSMLFLCIALSSGCNATPPPQPMQPYTYHAASELTKTREQINPSRSDLMRTIWSRDGVEILTQNDADENGRSICMIHPFRDQAKGTSLVIFFNKGRLSSVSGAPGLEGFSFAIDDFTRDGVPDFIQITDRNHTIVYEAYSIANGMVEPIPSRFFREDRNPFYYDDDIIAYLKQRLEQSPEATR